MCGIAGLVNLDKRPVDPGAIKRMCDTIAHRGPNDAGYAFFQPGDGQGRGNYGAAFVDPEFRHINRHLPAFGSSYFREEQASNQFSAALGHRRLSIIDLTHHGHQPMSTADGRYWITFNGEIYNFRELRNRLAALGHIFRSRSDTEVILTLWTEFGAAAFEMLDGMFAFAIYDRAAGALTLVRDRCGIKPVYYALAGSSFVFASEIKGVLASGLVSAELRPESLVEYMTFQNILGSSTLFEQVELLPAGEYLTVRSDGGTPLVSRRFHTGFPTADVELADEGAACELVAETFAAAVKRQLVSDVDVGAYLSGGMDSGSIVAVTARSVPRLLTFTGGFDLTNVNGLEQGFDERKQAEQLSYLSQTEHYDVVLHAGDMPAAMEQIAWHMDDPRVGMCHPNWYVAKLASRFVKVCLAGIGGDELFGGYPWRYARGVKAGSFEEFDDEYFAYWHRTLPPAQMPSLFSAGLRDYYPQARESFDRVMAAAPADQSELTLPENMLQRALHFDFKTFLHGLLVTEDRMSMAHGLETRVPFLDNALVDLAWRLPPSLKLASTGKSQQTPYTVLSGRYQNGALRLEKSERAQQPHLQSADGKRVLRRAMEAFLPPEFTRQPKQGFSPPDENWYRGPSMDYIKAVLLDRQARQRPWFDQKFVKDRLDEHFQARSNHRLLIWSLLSIEWLQKHYLDTAASAAQVQYA